MKKIFFFLLIFLAVVSGFFYIQNKKKQFNNNNFAAKINQKIISLKEFNEQLNLMIKITNIPYKSKGFNRKKFRSLLIHQLIEEKFILEEVQNIDLEIESINKDIAIALNVLPDYEVAYNLQSHNISIDFWEKKKEEIALKNYFFQSLKKNIEVSTEEVTNYYSNYFKNFIIPEKYEVEHIQVESLDVAEYLKEQVTKGADFTKFIDQYSIDEQFFLNGEKSFIIQKGQVPQSFENAILNSNNQKIKISLVNSNYGVHLFHLIRIIPEQKLALQKVRPQIIETIKRKKLPVVFDEWLKIKKKNSQILINQQFIENEHNI